MGKISLAIYFTQVYNLSSKNFMGEPSVILKFVPEILLNGIL